MQGELTPTVAPARANKLLGLELLRFLTAFASLRFTIANSPLLTSPLLTLFLQHLTICGPIGRSTHRFAGVSQPFLN